MEAMRDIATRALFTGRCLRCDLRYLLIGGWIVAIPPRTDVKKP